MLRRPQLFVFLSLALACGDDAAPHDGGLADTRHDQGSQLDGGSDGPIDGSVADDVPDAGPGECSFPVARIGRSAMAQSLANAPARCGAPAYSWLTDDPLMGTLVETGAAGTMDAAFLAGLVEAEGVSLPPVVYSSIGTQVYTYWTQDRGERVQATALVTFPQFPTPHVDPFPVVLLLHGTSGLTEGCGVSEEQASRAYAGLLSGYGYVTVLPDYIGLGPVSVDYPGPHPYLVGEPTAISSLDAIRAAAALPRETRGQVCMRPEVIPYGGSQGGHAALWTERYAPHYAAEMTLAGTIATVPPAALIAQSERALSGTHNSTGNVILAFAAMAPWYGVSDRLDEVFVAPWHTQIPEWIEADCLIDDDAWPETVEEVIQAPLRERGTAGNLADLQPWGCMLRENDVALSSVPRAHEYADSYGILFVTGDSDTLVHTPIERAGIATLCDSGLPIEYLECAGAGHAQATIWSIPEALDFINRRFDHEVWAASCGATEPVVCRGTPPELEKLRVTNNPYQQP